MTSYQTHNDNQPVDPETSPGIGSGWNDGVDYTKAVRASTHEPVVETGNILDTLRTPSGALGNPDMASLRDRVTVGGMEIEVANALKMGYVSRDRDGRLRATGKTAQDVVNETTRGDVKTPADDFFRDPKFSVDHAPEHRSFMEFVESKVPRSDLTRAYIEGMDNDTVHSLTMRRIGSALGVTPEKAEGVMYALAAAFEAQETEALKRLGIASAEDVARFKDWAQTEKSREYREAKLRQLISKDLGGIASMAQTYWRNLDKINPKAILSGTYGQGVSVRRLSSGEIVIRTPQGEMSWQSAVRSGIITLTPQGYKKGHRVGETGAKGAYASADPNWFRRG